MVLVTDVGNAYATTLAGAPDAASVGELYHRACYVLRASALRARRGETSNERPPTQPCDGPLAAAPARARAGTPQTPGSTALRLFEHARGSQSRRHIERAG